MTKEIAVQGPAWPTINHRVTGLRQSLICWIPDDPNKAMHLARDLTAAERQLIARELADVQLRLAARDWTAIERSITALMITFPSGRASGEEAEVMIAAYCATLCDLPAWAVEQTAREWMRGEGRAKANAFQPSAAELYQAADAKVASFRRAADEMRRMLTAIPRESSPEEKARVAAGLAKLAGQLRPPPTARDTPGAPGEGPYAKALREAAEPPAAGEAA